MPDNVTDLGEFWAGSTAVVTLQIQNELGQNWRPATFHVTLYDEDSGSVINSRDGAADLIAVVNATGLATVTLAPADMVLVNTFTRKNSETHRLVFKWTWNAGASVGYKICNFVLKGTHDN